MMKQGTRTAILTWTGVLGAVAGFAVSSSAKPRPATNRTTTSGAASKSASRTEATKTASQRASRPLKPLPRYVSLDTINVLRALRGERGEPVPGITPMWDGHPVSSVPGVVPVGVEALNSARGGRAGTRLAQSPILPRPVPPAAVRRTAATPVVPRWVRYPLEFQLAGIGLGTKAVDKDRFNRIDRYGLFAMHGNPSAVVVSLPDLLGTGGGEGGAGGGAPSGGGPGGGAPGGGAPGGAPGAPGEGGGGQVTQQQEPPEMTRFFPDNQQGGFPDWASAVTVKLDGNHVEWLYKRDTYSMGFVVDRLGFVDAIVVAGTQSPSRTQLEDPVHTIKLGDDTRKVLFRYGYPDSFTLYSVSVAGGTITAAPPGGAAAGGAAAGGAAGGPGAAAGPPPTPDVPAAENTTANNSTFRIFDLRYEQSYNVVFTIINNRVVRIYIFGDPDFFTDIRRQQFRVSY